MKFILRIAVLALGAYGAWKLYEEYGQKLSASRGDFDEFAARARQSTHDAADKVSAAADDATDAITESAAEIKQAAVETQEAVNQKVR